MEKVEVRALFINRKKLKAEICRRCDERLRCVTSGRPVFCNAYLMENILDYIYGDQSNFVTNYILYQYEDNFMKIEKEFQEAKTVDKVVKIIYKYIFRKNE